MLSFRLPMLASLALIALCWGAGQARAGDLEDCTGPFSDKTEPACTAILNDARRPAEDRLKAYAARSRFFARGGKPDAALADAEAAVQLNQQSSNAFSARAYAHQRAGQLDAALANYNRAAELEPKNPSVLILRGFLRSDQKAWTEALSDFNGALALRQDALAYVGRGRVYIETGQLDQALSDLNAALAMSTTVQNGFYWRGQAYRRKGDIDRAIDDFSRAIAQAPQTERAAYNAARSSSSPKATTPAPSPISTSCCRWCRATRPCSRSARPLWRCRRN